MRSPRRPFSESTSQDKTFARGKAEEIRLRTLYRMFVIRGGGGVAPDAVRGLVGPDCAYHLYRNLGGGDER